MSKRTKKVGSTGRFGPRYGTRTKKVIREIEKLQRKKHMCPKCERYTLKRVAAGIWECKKCGAKIAGGAYLPKSPAEKILRQLLGRY
jgi:large subunit ribosomal protein L37Ae